MRLRGRTDANHEQIIKELRKMGVSVLPMSNLGSGAPDILCGFRGQCFTFEIKPKGKKVRLTDDEKDFHLAWNGQVAVIQSAQDALDIMCLSPNSTKLY